MKVVGALLAFLWLFLAPSVSALPPDFDDRVVYTAGRLVTDLDWAPKEGGGHVIIITKKNGQIEVLTDPDNNDEKVVALDLDDAICTKGGQGIRGTAVHPNFLQTRWLYVFYTWDRGDPSCPESFTTGPVNRVSRFTLDASWKADRASERVFFNTRPLGLHGTHHGGCLVFGKDGYLYVTTGDASEPLKPLSPSQDYSDLFGKVLRFTDDGEVPASNPYVGTSGSAPCAASGKIADGQTCTEIYAGGLRNPYKCAVDPNSEETKLYVNDVGGGTWEEISLVARGANLGWPIREGPCPIGQRSGCSPDDDMVDPVFWYEHNENNNGAITGADFIPDGVWPSNYDGAYFFAQYVFGKVNYIIPSGAQGCPYPQCDPPNPEFSVDLFENLQQVTSFNFLPYRNTMAAFYVQSDGINNVRRVTYTGSQMNKLPVAVIRADKTTGAEGLVVQFDGTESSDVDGDILAYEWDFGDGSPLSTEPRPTHTYIGRGTFVVNLVVTDPLGQEGRDSITIVVGTPPTPVIVSPEEGTTFAVGDLYVVSGYATDHTGAALADSQLAWEVRRHHADHYHPFLYPPTPGNNLTIDPAPPPEDYFATRNSYLEVLLTATDNDGLSTTVSRTIQPKMVLLGFNTDPMGLELNVDYYDVTTPAVVYTWENHGLRVEAPNQGLHTFTSWSDGKEQTHFVVVPPAISSDPEAITANFTATFTSSEILGMLMKTDDKIFSGTPVDFASLDMFIQVTRTGQVLLSSGSSSNPGQLRWQTQPQGQDNDYFLALQPDGNLVVRGGVPGNVSDVLWTSASSGVAGAYFLAVNSDNTIALYRGTLDSPGDIVWKDSIVALETSTPTDPPTPGPTSSPSASPTMRPTLAQTSTPTPAPTPAPTNAPTNALPGRTPAPVELDLNPGTLSDPSDTAGGSGSGGWKNIYLLGLLALLIPVAWILFRGRRRRMPSSEDPHASFQGPVDVEAEVAAPPVDVDVPGAPRRDHLHVS